MEKRQRADDGVSIDERHFESILLPILGQLAVDAKMLSPRRLGFLAYETRTGRTLIRRNVNPKCLCVARIIGGVDRMASGTGFCYEILLRQYINHSG